MDFEISGREQMPPPGVGDPAPELELPGLDGTPFRLEKLRGQAVLVSFLRHAG